MKLFNSRHKDGMKDENSTTGFMTGLGHTPLVDWIATLCLCIVVIFGIVIFASIRYINVDTFIHTLPLQNANTEVVQTKTKEEKLQEIVGLYKEKQENHSEILSVTKKMMAKSVTESATSTATTSISERSVPMTDSDQVKSLGSSTSRQ